MDDRQFAEQVFLSDNTKTVLSEILAALKNLAEEGEEYTIFIDKMGLSAAERQDIRDIIGVGGVRINYDSTSQPVEWLESATSGIWFGVFYDQNRNPMMETIEICRFPQIAAAQAEDIKNGCAELSEKLGRK
jgi:hydrogenase-1 operon protein HyaF